MGEITTDCCVNRLESIHHFGSAPVVAYLVLMDEENHDEKDLQEEDKEQQEEELQGHKEKEHAR